MTLAYLDILFEEGYESPNCPKNFIGQPRLPLAFRVAGTGTYFTPYFLDTSDVLLQAVSQANSVNAFIDDKWVQYIIELNDALCGVQSLSLERDLRDLYDTMMKLEKKYDLGQLQISLCVFWKTDDLMDTGDNSSHYSRRVAST